MVAPGPATSTWGPRTEVPAPNFSLAQPQQLQTFGEGASAWETCVSPIEKER